MISKKVTFKMPRVSKWPLIKKNIYYQKRLQSDEISWSKLNKILNAADTFYLDENGWTIQSLGKDVIPHGAACMFCRFEIKEKDDKSHHFYAWRQKNDKENLGGIQFGTRLKIDAISFEKLNN